MLPISWCNFSSAIKKWRRWRVHARYPTYLRLYPEDKSSRSRVPLGSNCCVIRGRRRPKGELIFTGTLRRVCMVVISSKQISAHDACNEFEALRKCQKEDLRELGTQLGSSITRPDVNLGYFSLKILSSRQTTPLFFNYSAIHWPFWKPISTNDRKIYARFSQHPN